MSHEGNVNFENRLKVLKEKIAKGEEIRPEERIRVAVLADSPTVVTGFGNVCREVIRTLYETGMYEFDIVGINYDGSPHNFPYRIYPAFSSLIPDPMYRDVFGRQRFLDILGEGRFDIVWVLQDSFIVGEQLAQVIQQTNDELPADKRFAFVYYFPIDATPKKQWIDNSALRADIPVVYTRYGRDEVLKLYAVDEHSKLTEEEKERNKKDGALMANKLEVLYHGCNTRDFFPIEDKEIVSAIREKL